MRWAVILSIEGLAASHDGQEIGLKGKPEDGERGVMRSESKVL